MKQASAPNREAFTAREVAAAMGFHERTVRDLVRAGQIRGVRIGGSVRIPREEVDRLLGRTDGKR